MVDETRIEMKVVKIKFNGVGNEGYFVEKRKGYVQVIIKEGEAVELRDISSIREIRISEVTLKAEEVEGNGSYLG